MQLYHTFISYSRADAEFALKLANDMRAAGINIWLDQLDIPPGARWDRAVEDALKTSGRILVVLSPTSSSSENVLDEIGLAFDQSKPIVPVLSKPCDIPMRLRRLQYIDFTKDYDQGLRTLLTVMKLPITSPEAGAGTVAPSDSSTPPVAESRVGYTAPSTPEAKAQSPLTSRRNLFVGLGVVALIALSILILNSRSGASAGELPCDKASQVTSARLNEQMAAKITFANKSKETIVVFWVGYDGKEEKYVDLKPGESYHQDTYKGHFWLIKDQQGKCLKLFEAPGSFVIE